MFWSRIGSDCVLQTTIHARSIDDNSYFDLHYIKSIIYLLSPGNHVRYHLVWRAYIWITSSNRCMWIKLVCAQRIQFKSKIGWLKHRYVRFSNSTCLFTGNVEILTACFNQNRLRYNLLTDLNQTCKRI